MNVRYQERKLARVECLSGNPLPTSVALILMRIVMPVPTRHKLSRRQFILTRSQTISALRIWGVYDPDNSPGAHDDMTVLFHEDGAGLPGAVIASAFDVPTVRTDTGVDEYGLDVYVLTLTLSRPVSLGAGTYLVEVYNNTEDNSDSFVWESGDLDPDYGVPGIAFARQAPGVDWFFLGGDANMSLEIVARATDCKYQRHSG